MILAGNRVRIRLRSGGRQRADHHEKAQAISANRERMGRRVVLVVSTSSLLAVPRSVAADIKRR